jgi:tetratricopeptide (TPR) repeat protein
MNDFQQWQCERILSRAHNNLGYLYYARGSYGQAVEELKNALNRRTEQDLAERSDALNNLAFIYGLLGNFNDARHYIERAVTIRERLARRRPLALSYNTSGLINTLSDDPTSGAKDCERALQISHETHDARVAGLAYLGLGFAKRRSGNQWKLQRLSPLEAADYFQQAKNHFDQALLIFTPHNLRTQEFIVSEQKSDLFEVVDEPLRKWETLNELGSLFCDWAWLTWRNGDIEHSISNYELALEQYQQSINYQKQAVTLATENKWLFQKADSLDDLAQAYGDQSFLLLQMYNDALVSGNTENANRLATAVEQSRQEAERLVDKIQDEIPQFYTIRHGKGFQKKVQKGEAHLLNLGKVFLWRGVWNCRDVLMKSLSPEQQEQMIRLGTEQMCLAVTYFQRYWPNTFAQYRTVKYLITFLSDLGRDRMWAREQIQAIEVKYKIKLDSLNPVITDLLG